MSDFSLEQTADLNRRHGSPLREGDDSKRFHRLTRGQPYITRRVLHDLVNEGLSLDEFTAKAASDDGPLGDHLRRILVMLARDPALTDSVRLILARKAFSDHAHFYRLRSAGVISGEAREEARMRCEIYERYLKKHL